MSSHSTLNLGDGHQDEALWRYRGGGGGGAGKFNHPPKRNGSGSGGGGFSGKPPTIYDVYNGVKKDDICAFKRAEEQLNEKPNEQLRVAYNKALQCMQAMLTGTQDYSGMPRDFYHQNESDAISEEESFKSFFKGIFKKLKKSKTVKKLAVKGLGKMASKITLIKELDKQRMDAPDKATAERYTQEISDVLQTVPEKDEMLGENESFDDVDDELFEDTADFVRVAYNCARQRAEEVSLLEARVTQEMMKKEHVNTELVNALNQTIQRRQQMNSFLFTTVADVSHYYRYNDVLAVGNNLPQEQGGPIQEHFVSGTTADDILGPQKYEGRYRHEEYDGKFRDESLLEDGGKLMDMDQLRGFMNCLVKIEGADSQKKWRASGFYAQLPGDEKKIGIFTNDHVARDIKDSLKKGGVALIKFFDEKEKIKDAFHISIADNAYEMYRGESEHTKPGEKLDYSFWALSLKAKEKIKSFGISPVKLEKPKTEPKVGDSVMVFQHPKGRTAQYSLGTICSATKTTIGYKANTECGSSGSPVVMENTIVALHKAGTSTENRGVRISSILNDIEKVYGK